MNEKQKARATLKVVRDVINKLDVYSLLSEGSPYDEYESEITSISSKINKCESGMDVARAISDVLNRSFSETQEPETYEKEGFRIYNALVDLGIK